MKKIYLAIPYTEIKDKSFRIANRVAGLLIEMGYVVFSPISHSHSIWSECKDLLENDFETWMAQDEPFLQWADELYVIDIKSNSLDSDGLGLIYRSKGVKREIEIAKELKKPIILIQYDEDSDRLTIFDKNTKSNERTQ